MGQYFLAVNLDRREYVDPHAFGHGAKLLELLGDSASGVGGALALLLADSVGAHPFFGRWSGERVAFVGDWTPLGDDVPAADRAALTKKYGDEASRSHYVRRRFRDISAEAMALLLAEYPEARKRLAADVPMMARALPVAKAKRLEQALAGTLKLAGAEAKTGAAKTKSRGGRS